VQIFYSNFHTNQTIIVQSTDRNSFLPLSKVWPFLFAGFHATGHSVTHYEHILCQFHSVNKNSVKYGESSIYALQKSTVFTAPIFTKLIAQHYLDVPYQIPPKIDQEIWEVRTGMTVTEPIFMKLTHARQFFLMNYYIKFHENPTNSSVADTWSQTNRMTEIYVRPYLLLSS